MMDDLSLLDWLGARLGTARAKMAIGLGLATAAALWALIVVQGRGLTFGSLALFLLAVGCGAWGLMARGEAAITAPVPAIELRPRVALPSAQWIVRWRWLGLPGGVVLAILAQRSWTEARDTPLTGVILVAVAAALFLLAVWREGLGLPRSAPAAAVAGADDWPAVRVRAALVAAVLSLLTYFAVPDNSFTVVGRVTWALSLGAWLMAFWEGPIRLNLDWRAALARLWGGEVNLRLSRTMLLLVAVLVVTAGFRFARLEAVPPEMTSDHIEKLLDVNDILNRGKRPIFEPTNGGREPMQFYLAAVTAKYAGTGLSHLTLKLVTAAAGFLTVPLIFLAAREFSRDDVTALLAALAAGIAWWPNSISRNGLRFPFAALFAALALWLLLRGLRRGRRNDVLLAGLAAGLGLYGYTPMRAVPLGMALALGLYALHAWSRVEARRMLAWSVFAGVVVLAAFVPLFRYAQDEPQYFWERTLTRITGDPEAPAQPALLSFAQNEWNSLRMFSWTSDSAWLVSPPGQPALDWVMGGTFLLGVAFLLYRYLRFRAWVDLFLLLAIPVLLLPSTLALAFPAENPSLHRSGPAIPVVFTIVALPLRLLIEHSRKLWGERTGRLAGLGMCAGLLVISAQANWRIMFVDYVRNYARSAQNASEVGAVVRAFAESVGSYETAFVRAYPFWVDTRAVGIYAGRFGWDQAILTPERLAEHKDDPRPKLFILHRHDFVPRPDGQPASLPILRSLYPDGVLSVYHSAIQSPDKDFLIFWVPGAQDVDESSLPPPP